MKKKFFFIGILMLSCMTNSFAQGGTTGPLTWKIENHILTISGNGDMPNYDAPTQGGGPWNTYTYASAIIESGVTSIGEFAFVHSLMNSISIPNSVTRIREGAFAWSALQSIIVPNGVITIEEGTFALCHALTTVTLASSVVSFAEWSIFTNCSALTTITNLNPVPVDISINNFGGVNISACTLKVPKNSIDAYKKAPVWREFIIVGIEVDIDEYEKETDNGEPLLIYPNPNTGTCSIVIPAEFQNERFLTLSIYDNSGKKVQEISIDNENPAYSLKLDSKAAGVYVAVLSNGKRSVKGRIVFN